MSYIRSVALTGNSLHQAMAKLEATRADNIRAQVIGPTLAKLTVLDHTSNLGIVCFFSCIRVQVEVPARLMLKLIGSTLFLILKNTNFESSTRNPTQEDWQLELQEKDSELQRKLDAKQRDFQVETPSFV